MSRPDAIATPAVAPAASGRVAAAVCWTLILLLAGTLAWRSTARGMKPAPPPVPSAEVNLAGQSAVALARWAASADPSLRPTLSQLAAQFVHTADQSARTPADRLALIPVVYETTGKDAALDRLAEAGPGDDADALRRVYRRGTSPASPADRARLADGLGWFGQLAVTQGAASSDPDRDRLLRGATRRLVATFAFEGVIGGAILIGIVLAVVAVVLMATGKLTARYVPPPAGPPTMLVVFTTWFYGYLGLQVVGGFLGSSLAVVVVAGMVWTGVVVLWPVVLGRNWAGWRRSLGLSCGRGVLTEMACGVIGYVAGLPLIAVAAGASVALIRVSGVDASHPIVNQLAGVKSAGEIVGLFLLVGVSAPLVEETVFRGALFGHVRRRLGPVASGGVVGLLFAAVHPQGWAAIPVLAAVGFVLAMLRQWRGSLVASMTAHGLSNGVVTLVVMLVLS